MPEHAPWLANKHWRNNTIKSSAQRAHWMMWLFALLLNGITVALLLRAGEFITRFKQEPASLFILAFPLAGLVLTALAARATAQWRRFGRTPLVLDPFPGSLGGHVGGTIDLPIAAERGQLFKVQLSCIRSYVSGTGKRRTRRTSARWQAEGACHNTPVRGATRLTFRFDTPADLPASDIKKSQNYHLWRVAVSASLEGVDFARHYDIPVFATVEQSAGIAVGTESHPDTTDMAMDGIASVAQIQPVPGGIEASFPAMQRPGQGLLLVLFGSTFAGIGIAAGIGGSAILVSTIFTFVGSLMAAAGAFYLGKSLRVKVSREGIVSRRFVFGYPITTRRLSARELSAIKIVKVGSVSSGQKTTLVYQLHALGADSRKFPVAERLNGLAEAELLKESYDAYLGKS